MVVEKARRQTDPAPGGNVGQRGVVVCAVEIGHPARTDDPVLHGPERGRGAAADHQRSAAQIRLRDQILLRKRVVTPGDQIDVALKQVVNNNVRELTSPLAQREEQIRLMLEKALHPALILKLRNDLHLGRLLGKQPHGLRQKIDRLAHHQTDRDRVLPGAAVILPLLDRALELCPQIGKKAYKLAARRGQ